MLAKEIDYMLKRSPPLAAFSTMAASASATLPPSGPFATGETPNAGIDTAEGEGCGNGCFLPEAISAHVIIRL
jgi:hypothetical protein